MPFQLKKTSVNSKMQHQTKTLLKIIDKYFEKDEKGITQ